MNRDETDARDRAFLAADGMNARDGRLWNEAWAAARDYYAPNADIANDLRDRILPPPTREEMFTDG